MAAYEVLLLNTAVPQIQAAQAGDTYVVPRDIAFSAALTLSAGTANGVPYLNGSKVLTSGSALTFDGTDIRMPNGGSILVGASVAGASLIAINGTAAAQRIVLGTSGTDAVINATRTSGTSPNLLFQLESSEQMRLTSKAFMVGYTDDSGFSGQYNAAFSGNVGIGTSSPATRLEAYVGTDVNADNININVLTLTGIDNTGGYYYANQGAGVAFRSGLVAGATRGPEIMGAIYGANSASESVANGQLTFHTRTSGSVTEKMRLDSSGNLGLGITPSAWGVFKALQVSYMGIAANTAGTGDGSISWNAYNNGTNWLYSYTGGAATRYRQNESGHAWYTAPSGTAGDAISFTQAMTLDASGRLLVGPTSAASVGNANFAVTGGSVYDGNFSLIAQLTNDTTAAGKGVLLGFNNSTNTGIISAAYGNGSESLAFWTHNNTSWGERARITSGGYFKASNDGTYYASTSAYHELRQTSATAGDATLVLTATNASLTGDIVYARSSRAANTAFRFYVADANGTDQFYVRGDGAIYAQNTTVQSISDARLKENIRNASEGLNVITALRPVRYDWKSGYGNDRKDQLGFIAQEVESVFPEAVSEWKGKEGDETYKTVGPGALIPVLVKAIQEQQAMINELKAEVAALKGN